MHDKVDHVKTASLMFLHKTKQLDGFMKLHVLVTRMLAHGYGDDCYAHYDLDLFAYDSNYIINSFTKHLLDLEMPPKSSSRRLLISQGQVRYLRPCYMEQKCARHHWCPCMKHQFWYTISSHSECPNGQYCKEKQQPICVLFLVLACYKRYIQRGLREFHIGHTHNDIDVLFERWSMTLRKENFPSIPLFMKSFMDVESVPTIVHLIEEVQDFKAFIDGCITKGDEALEGHTKAKQFKLFIDSNGCSMMKYWIHYSGNDWLLKEDGDI
jgi:hypothetical protein